MSETVARPILFVDNQDSFVWNLVDYVSAFYPETVVRSNRVTLAEVSAFRPMGIVISPGPGHPANQRDIGSCLDIIRQFYQTPILGICLGHQAMNIAYGARSPTPGPCTARPLPLCMTARASSGE